MNSSIWEHFASGSFSPGTSPAFLSGPGAAELARLQQELDEANGTIKQWEESWKQAKQVLGPMPSLPGPGGTELMTLLYRAQGVGEAGVLENRAETQFCSVSPVRPWGGWYPWNSVSHLCGLVPGAIGLSQEALTLQGSSPGFLVRGWAFQLGPAPFPAHRGSLGGPETSLLCRQCQLPPCLLPTQLTHSQQAPQPRWLMQAPRDTLWDGGRGPS